MSLDQWNLLASIARMQGGVGLDTQTFPLQEHCMVIQVSPFSPWIHTILARLFWHQNVASSMPHFHKKSLILVVFWLMNSGLISLRPRLSTPPELSRQFDCFNHYSFLSKGQCSCILKPVTIRASCLLVISGEILLSQCYPCVSSRGSHVF